MAICRFDAMSFETRMKKSYESSLEGQIIVVKDNSIPVGYAFSTIEYTESNIYICFRWQRCGI